MNKCRITEIIDNGLFQGYDYTMIGTYIPNRMHVIVDLEVGTRHPSLHLMPLLIGISQNSLFQNVITLLTTVDPTS